MEEKKIEERERFGMELLPSLHRALKTHALAHDRKLYEVVQEAFERYLGTGQAEPERRIPRALRHYIDKLAEILESGDDLAIRAATVAIDYARGQLRPAAEAPRRR